MQATPRLLSDDDAGPDPRLVFFRARDRDVKPGVTQTLERGAPVLAHDPRRCQQPTR